MNRDLDQFRLKGPTIHGLLEKLGTLMSQNIPGGWAFTILVFEPESQGELYACSSIEDAQMMDVIDQFYEKLKEGQSPSAEGQRERNTRLREEPEEQDQNHDHQEHGGERLGNREGRGQAHHDPDHDAHKQNGH
jgi:membrane protein involved in colicin uptake